MALVRASGPTHPLFTFINSGSRPGYRREGKCCKIQVSVFLLVCGDWGETEITCRAGFLKNLYFNQFGKRLFCFFFKNPKAGTQMGCLVLARAGITT